MDEETSEKLYKSSLRGINCLNETNAHNLMDFNCTFSLLNSISETVFSSFFLFAFASDNLCNSQSTIETVYLG